MLKRIKSIRENLIRGLLKPPKQAWQLASKAYLPCLCRRMILVWDNDILIDIIIWIYTVIRRVFAIGALNAQLSAGL